MSEGQLTADDGRLATDLAATLEPGLQDALNHPTRREILRVLHRVTRPWSVTETLVDLPDLNRGEISYHVQVLVDSACVEVVGTRPAPGGTERLFRSSVSGDDQALLVLGATQRSDRKLRQRSVENDSPSMLTMFRIPRPERAIQLVNRHRRESEAR